MSDTRKFECNRCGNIFDGFYEVVGANDMAVSAGGERYGPLIQERRVFPQHCPTCKSPTNARSFLDPEDEDD